MKQIVFSFFLLVCFFNPFKSFSQIEEDQMGAWYMFFFNGKFTDSQWGVQGDIQHRNWNLGGDLEQLLLRGGVTYTPKNTNLLLTLGYGNITSGAFGESKETLSESRIYQEALFPTQIAKRFFLKHRFRYEQRFVENQDMRTRFRYNLFVNVPLNKSVFEPRTIYLALYNELFINGEKNIGNGKEVTYFDRNRLYAAFGYVIKKGLSAQLGVMTQTLNTTRKRQLQLSLHYNFE